MATTKLNNNLAITKWQSQFLKDYVAQSGFKKYMGKNGSSIITAVDDLKGGGETVVVPLVARLRGAGVSGSTKLVGSEDTLGTYSDQVRVKLLRNAVSVGKDQVIRSELDLYNAAKAPLNDWAMTGYQNEIVGQLQSFIVTSTPDADGFTFDTSVPYANASDASKNAHLVANTDRIMIGNSSAAYKTAANGVWSTAVAKLDATADKITAATLKRAKAMALATQVGSTFGISPISIDDDSGESTFVFFCCAEQFADLEDDAEIKENYQRAAMTGMKNPLFTSGDLMLDGIIIRKIQHIQTLGGIGKSGATVARGFLCGRQAITTAWGQAPTAISDVTDYGFQRGVGIEEVRGSKKTSFGGIQYGVVDVLSATTPLTF